VVPLYGGNVASVMSGVLMYPRKCTWIQWRVVLPYVAPGGGGRVCARGDSNGAPPPLTVTRVSGPDCGQAPAAAVRPHLTLCQRSAMFEDTRWLERRVPPHALTEPPLAHALRSWPSLRDVDIAAAVTMS